MSDFLSDVLADAEKRKLLAEILRLTAELVDIADPDGKTPLSLLTKAPPEPDEDEDEEDEDGDEEKLETEEKLA